jgi:hypothetical protein
MAAGHVTFQLFPLFAVIMVILTYPRFPAWLGGVFLSLVITLLLYSGIHNVPFFLLSALISFPLLYLIKPTLLHWKQIFSIILWGGSIYPPGLWFEIIGNRLFHAFFPSICPG